MNSDVEAFQITRVQADLRCAMWTIPEALPLVRQLMRDLDPHHVLLSMYGSVMRRGESQHDLDLLAVDLYERHDPRAVLEAPMRRVGFSFIREESGIAARTFVYADAEETRVIDLRWITAKPRVGDR